MTGEMGTVVRERGCFPGGGVTMLWEGCLVREDKGVTGGMGGVAGGNGGGAVMTAVTGKGTGSGGRRR